MRHKTCRKIHVVSSERKRLQETNSLFVYLVEQLCQIHLGLTIKQPQRLLVFKFSLQQILHLEVLCSHLLYNAIECIRQLHSEHADGIRLHDNPQLVIPTGTELIDREKNAAFRQVLSTVDVGSILGRATHLRHVALVVELLGKGHQEPFIPVVKHLAFRPERGTVKLTLYPSASCSWRNQCNYDSF